MVSRFDIPSFNEWDKIICWLLRWGLWVARTYGCVAKVNLGKLEYNWKANWLAARTHQASLYLGPGHHNIFLFFKVFKLKSEPGMLLDWCLYTDKDKIKEGKCGLRFCHHLLSNVFLFSIQFYGERCVRLSIIDNENISSWVLNWLKQYWKGRANSRFGW